MGDSGARVVRLRNIMLSGQDYQKGIALASVWRLSMVCCFKY